MISSRCSPDWMEARQIPDPSPAQRDVDRLLALAQSFRSRERYAAAAELVQLAQQLDPTNEALRLTLAELRRLQHRRRAGQPPPSLRETLQEEMRRQAIDGTQFLGLAALYADRGETGRALECLDIAQAKDPTNPAVHKLLGRLRGRRQDFVKASEELARALRYNPFDRDTAEALGRVEYERRRFEDALKATIHAFLLLQEDRDPPAELERLRRRIQTLKGILGVDNDGLRNLFRQVRETLNTAFDRLEWQRERFLEEGGLLDATLTPTHPLRPSGSGLIDTAARLRRLGAWEALTDEGIVQLARCTQEETLPEGATLFRHGKEGRSPYLVEQGRVGLARSTPYGDIPLAEVGAGELLGEATFVNHGLRFGEATALESVVLLRLDAEALDRLIEEQPELGVQVLWSLWHSMARKLRAANERLRDFVGDSVAPSTDTNTALKTAGGAVRIDERDKIALFREQGLSAGELTTLATFLDERRYPTGALLFQEGEEGREMFVILEGKARISKALDGNAEEALAILGRGAFFGEMALLDGEPRSADARAHDGPLTVLVLDQQAFGEIRALDPQAALQFLSLMCRLVARRMEELNNKRIAWHILAGAAGDRPPIEAQRLS